MFKLFLTFDCEDFINPKSTSALLRILEMLHENNLRGIFFLTSDMCEKLQNYPTVLDMLEGEQVGYHGTSHSTHPLIPEYTDTEDRQVAFHTSLDRERAKINPLTGEVEGKGGILLLRETFRNNRIISFRAPGFCWSPDHIEALEQLGIRFDFSTNISQIPARLGKITFYPIPEKRYGLKPVIRSILRAGFRSKSDTFPTCLQYSLLLIHPDYFVNNGLWDSIYFDGNPKRLQRVPSLSVEKTERRLRDFGLFLKGLRVLVKSSALEVTPELEDSQYGPHLDQNDAYRVYLRSVMWSRRFFGYEPKFLRQRFLEYFHSFRPPLHQSTD